MKIQKLDYGQMKSIKPLEKRNKIEFFDFLWKKIEEVDLKEKRAQEAILALAKGDDIDPAEVAMHISQADSSMKLLLRVRNKVLEAYQEIMRMQI